VSTRRCPPGETVREHYAHGGQLGDEDLTTPEHLLHRPLPARLRSELPEGMKALTEFVVDNPVQVSVTVAGMVVVSRIGFNLVKPRTAVQGVALLLVLNVLSPWLVKQAIERGVISFRLRDGEGGFVSARELIGSLREDDAGAPRRDPAR
jgi:hypothetical protein